MTYVIVDLAAWVCATLPGGTSLGEMSGGGLWLLVDAVLLRMLWRGSWTAVNVSFVIALLPAALYAATLLPIAVMDGVHTENVALNLGFGLPEALLLLVAMVSGDRRERRAVAGAPFTCIDRSESRCIRPSSCVGLLKLK